MTSASPCPSCGAPLARQLQGLCARCLLRLAADTPEPMPAEETDDAAGRSFAGYELSGEIARGGMGIVYRARQVSADRMVALKVMLPRLLSQPGMRERFQREVTAVAKLDHPNILPVYEVREQSGLPCFTMKLAEGGGLDQRIAGLAGHWREIASLVATLAHAVEHAHQRGILHRDLKPANILFDARDTPMIADFGLAKFRLPDGAATLPAQALGSPNYMAPEQVSAQFGEPGPATDVYGLGAVLYELLTGAPPIEGASAADTLRLVPALEPAPARSRRADVPPDLDAIALKCLAKSPEARYPSAAALAQDLERWLVGSGAAAVSERRSRGARRLALGLVATALLGALFAWAVRREPARTVSAAAPATAPRSVGVVPFHLLSEDPRDAGLSTLVTDDLLRELRQINSLDVLPFRVGDDRGGNQDPASLAAQLGVEMLLTGDVTRGPAGVEVRARLWDARTRGDVWQRNFASDEQDLRELRAQIAEALVTGLQLRLGSDERRSLDPGAPTSSADAYRQYLRARYLLRWRRPETLTEAASELRGAFARDPQFARAASALAAVYSLWIPNLPCADGEPRELARQWADRALALDARLAEPHAVLGRLATMQRQFVDAEAHFQRALAVDPRDPTALHLYSIHLYAVGRLRDALDAERRSVALDGTSAQPMMWLAMLTTLRGERDDALRLWRRTEEMGAARPLSAALVRLELGEVEPLEAWFHNRAERVGLPETMAGEEFLRRGLEDTAARPQALAWLRKAEAHTDPALAITLYALLGSEDDAFRIASGYDLALDRSYLLSPANLWVPGLAGLRRDNRFAALAERWGLAEYWQRVAPGDLCEMKARSIVCR